MNKKFILYLLGCLIIGALFLAPVSAGASALIATLTASPTFIPPSATPTAYNKICPIGTPAGWGTYTPSPLWSLECGSCNSFMTSTPTSSPSPYPTYSGTGTPTIYPTITPTNTVTPTSTPVTASTISCGSGSTAGFTCTQVNSYTVRYTGAHYVPYPQSHPYLDMRYDTVQTSAFTVYTQFYTQGLYGAQYVFIAGGLQPPSTTITLQGMAVGQAFPYSIRIFPMTRFYENGNTHGDYINAGLYETSYTQPSWAAGQYILRVTDGDLWSYRTHYWEAGNTGYVLVSVYPFGGTATPSPAPSPTPILDTGYCSSVAPVLDDFGFDLFVPDGVVNCSIGWDGFTVGETVFPSVQICFQPSQFGVVRLFGSDFEIGVIALAVAGAFIWRFVRTV
jgi:hypothetical protein